MCGEIPAKSSAQNRIAVQAINLNSWHCQAFHILNSHLRLNVSNFTDDNFSIPQHNLTQPLRWVAFARKSVQSFLYCATHTDKQFCEQTVKKSAKVIIERYYPKLTLDFETNKRICDEIAIIASKRLRNKVRSHPSPPHFITS